MKLSKLLQEVEVSIIENQYLNNWVTGVNLFELSMQVDSGNEALVLDFEAQFYCEENELLTFEHSCITRLELYVDDEDKTDSITNDELIEIEEKLSTFLKAKI